MTLSSPIRVVILDDHVLIRSALSLVLSRQAAIMVVGEADNQSLVEGIFPCEAPDILLLDLDDPDALTHLGQYLATPSGIPVIALSKESANESHCEAVRLGVRGLVLKTQELSDLVRAIENVHRGDLWLSRALMTQLLGQFLQPPQRSPQELPLHASLSKREKEVMTLVSLGLKNQKIGAQLHISESTVRHHLTSIYSKLYISDRVELLIYAYKHNLVERPSPREGSHVGRLVA